MTIISTASFLNSIFTISLASFFKSFFAKSYTVMGGSPRTGVGVTAAGAGFFVVVFLLGF